MYRLRERELMTLIRRMERDYARSHIPEAVLSYYHQPARLEFPLGELTNPRLGGFVWTWHTSGKLHIARIRRSDCFNAQGLEGKCEAMPLALSTALLTARELPPYRRAIYVAHKNILNERRWFAPSTKSPRKAPI